MLLLSRSSAQKPPVPLVTSPPGLAHNKYSATYLEYVNADTVIGSTADALGRADVWRFDSLLGPAGTPELLGPGSSSGIVWMEISVKQGVHAFTAELEATASAPNGVASSILVFADTGVEGPAWTDTVAIAGDRVAYAFTATLGFTNVQVRIDGHAVPVLGTIVADGNAHAITATADH